MPLSKQQATASPRGFIASVVSITHSLGHINIQGIPILYPILRDHFAFGYIGIALLTLVSQIASGPLQICFGVLTRLARRFHILAFGNALAFLGTLAMAASQNFAHLVLGRALRGLGTCTYHPVGGAVMASLFPNDRAKALGFYDTAGNIGSLIAPLLLGALLQMMHWRSVILILGAPFLITTLLCFAVREDAPPIPAPADRQSDRYGFQEYKAVLQDRNSIILSLTMMMGAGGRGGGVIQTYLTVLLVDRFGISVSFAAILFSAYTLGALFGPMAMGWFSDRSSPLLAVRLNLILSSVFIVLILSPGTPGFLLGSIVALAGFFVGSRNSLLQALLIQSGTRNARVDTQLSMYYSIGAISGPVWTLLIGFLVDRFGMGSAIWTMALSYVCATIALSLIRLEQSVETAKPRLPQ